jgi:hypothetical protein
MNVVEGQGHGRLYVPVDPADGSSGSNRWLLGVYVGVARGASGKEPKVAENGKKPRQISAEDKVMMLS